MQRRSSPFRWAAFCALCCGCALAEQPSSVPNERETPAANGPPAAAQSEREQPPQRPAPNDEDATDRPAITIEDAAAIVLQAYGGRVVQQETLSEERGYRIRVDVKGRVKTVFVDLSGRVREQPPRQRDAPADR